jgi:hypothetical protein
VGAPAEELARAVRARAAQARDAVKAHPVGGPPNKPEEAAPVRLGQI